MTQHSEILTTEIKKQIDHWIAKFPAERKQSAALSALMIVQDHYGGWLTEAHLDAVADYLGVPRIAIYEVATFYSMYDLQKVGRYKIYVCTNISCLLRGCDKIVDHLKNKLSINFNETTADGKFTLKEAECLAACTKAPMMQINKDYYENLTPETVDKILDALE